MGSIIGHKIDENGVGGASGTYTANINPSTPQRPHHWGLRSVLVGLGRRGLADVAQKSRLLGDSAVVIISKLNNMTLLNKISVLKDV